MMAFVSATITISPSPALPALAITLTASFVDDSIVVTSTPLSLTDSILFPPASMFLPAMVTAVPWWPDEGVSWPITAAATCVQPLMAVTREPVFEVMITSTAFPTAPPPTSTIVMSLSFASAPTVTAMLPKVMDVTVLPPPRRRSPVICTTVPFCPADGLSLATAPVSR